MFAGEDTNLDYIQARKMKTPFTVLEIRKAILSLKINKNCWK